VCVSRDGVGCVCDHALVQKGEPLRGGRENLENNQTHFLCVAECSSCDIGHDSEMCLPLFSLGLIGSAQIINPMKTRIKTMIAPSIFPDRRSLSSITISPVWFDCSVW